MSERGDVFHYEGRTCGKPASKDNAMMNMLGPLITKDKEAQRAIFRGQKSVIAEMMDKNLG